MKPWDSSCYTRFDMQKGMLWWKKSSGKVDVPTLQGIECVFANVVSVILALAGIVLFIMFLSGGFKFLTSGGDQKQVEAAKGTLTHAVLGLAVLVFAYIIIQLIANFTGAIGILNFKIVE